MSMAVLIVGLLILVAAFAGALSPEALRKVLRLFLQRGWWNLAMTVRVVVGALFLLAAPGTRAPLLVQVFGILFILAGIAIPLMGSARLEKLAHWWLERPDYMFRLWAIPAGAFGAAILWSAL